MSEKAAKSRVASDFQFENRSLVDFQIGDERKGRNMVRGSRIEAFRSHAAAPGSPLRPVFLRRAR
tara:strand:+ start:625 stop:819 length:195 start_codon:yes stop_codon:yes gene_type:complete